MHVRTSRVESRPSRDGCCFLEPCNARNEERLVEFGSSKDPERRIYRVVEG